MVDWRNETRSATSSRSKTLSIRPSTQNCVVTQREVGLDTDSWEPR